MLRVQEGLDKAERSLPTMKSLASAWFRVARATLETLGLSAAEAVWVWSRLLPWVYLDTVHPRGPRKQDRARIGQVREAIWEKVRAVDGPWSRWGVERRTEVLSVLREVVALFVRGSSSVEGRNGQLSLSHHRVHTLTPKLLRVLTVLHNYVITRDDGSTAAQPFTGLPHADLFEHLLAAAPQPRETSGQAATIAPSTTRRMTPTLGEVRRETKRPVTMLPRMRCGAPCIRRPAAGVAGAAARRWADGRVAKDPGAATPSSGAVRVLRGVAPSFHRAGSRGIGRFGWI